MHAQAVSDGVLWAMERSTFRTIVLAARMQKRRRYEEVSNITFEVIFKLELHIQTPR